MALISISPWPALVGIVPDRQLAPYSCFGGVILCATVLLITTLYLDPGVKIDGRWPGLPFFPWFSPGDQ